jgi:hypothetical protein
MKFGSSAAVLGSIIARENNKKIRTERLLELHVLSDTGGQSSSPMF